MLLDPNVQPEHVNLFQGLDNLEGAAIQIASGSSLLLNRRELDLEDVIVDLIDWLLRINEFGVVFEDVSKKLI